MSFVLSHSFIYIIIIPRLRTVSIILSFWQAEGPLFLASAQKRNIGEVEDLLNPPT